MVYTSSQSKLTRRILSIGFIAHQISVLAYHHPRLILWDFYRIHLPVIGSIYLEAVLGQIHSLRDFASFHSLRDFASFPSLLGYLEVLV